VEQQHPQEKSAQPESAEIYAFPSPSDAHPRRRQEPPPTDEELAEYRKNRVAIMQMLAEWKQFKAQFALVCLECPVAAAILSAAEE